MKRLRLILFLTITIVLLNSCEKDESSSKNTNGTSIIGTWELRQAQNSMTPGVEHAPGNGNILKFTEDSTFEKYISGNLVTTGHYSIVRDTTVQTEVGLAIPAGQFTNRIIFDTQSTNRKTFMEIEDNKLTLISGYFPLDGGSMFVYEKQADTGKQQVR